MWRMHASCVITAVKCAHVQNCLRQTKWYIYCQYMCLASSSMYATTSHNEWHWVWWYMLERDNLLYYTEKKSVPSLMRESSGRDSYDFVFWFLLFASLIQANKFTGNWLCSLWVQILGIVCRYWGWASCLIAGIHIAQVQCRRKQIHAGRPAFSILSSTIYALSSTLILWHLMSPLARTTLQGRNRSC
jgi:hypothetical protein